VSAVKTFFRHLEHREKSFSAVERKISRRCAPRNDNYRHF